MKAPDLSTTRVALDLDLVSPGKRAGAARLRWSSNDNPLGHYPLPVMTVIGGDRAGVVEGTLKGRVMSASSRLSP